MAVSLATMYHERELTTLRERLAAVHNYVMLAVGGLGHQ